MTIDTRPAVRRRPRDRKQHILTAAGTRFWTDGYHQVSMAGIAADVGIGASALYRHFRGKQELLLAVLDQHLSALEALTAGPGGDVVTDLAAYTFEHREFGVLWEREAGHLPDEQRRELRHRLRGLAARVHPPGCEDADLRAWAALSVLDSPSHHRGRVTADHGLPVLVRAARAVLTAPLPAAGDDRPSGGGPGLTPASRREALLGAAVHLFARRGYPSVSLDDIGAATGIAGPSVYNHFTSKNEVLDAALNRGNEALWLGLHTALSDARDARDALTRLAQDYTTFALANPDLVGILISETVHLPADRQQVLRRAQNDYLAEWAALLPATCTTDDPPTAHLKVRAAVALANSVARIHHLRIRPEHAARTTALVTAVLDS
ncbi:transcriptional regulator, TetR family [Pseudonocardia ammonioxydans]|uniref:Transcriptional regulator, TetR family n=1 Tax=Pseudonocardia ammonioxydans TaxID=260086 RepID=A0A1I5HIS6_PSUAM|nr:TetR/AcrR family transcriptional regulator [Pseudonocardia ammonioxydans]SFO48165.1 transcriptional regulator, TetR family [Pseudonocardia ammonioxydans]